MKKITEIISIFLKGVVMGLIETVPGVSGSTVALVFGVYKKFINSIKKLDLKFLKFISNFEFKKAFQYADFGFLIVLVFGMFSGIFLSIFTISKLLKTNEQEVWAFFFGLVLITGFIILNKIFSLKKNKSKNKEENKEKIVSNKEILTNYQLFSNNHEVKKKDLSNEKNNILTIISVILASFVISFSIVSCIPAVNNSDISLIYVFLSGMFASAAFLLPGISGSFVLLLMGLYVTILENVKVLFFNFNNESFLLISVFAAGFLLGMVIFSRVINYILEKWEKITLAILSGVIFASLYKIWPWKIVDKVINSDGIIVNFNDIVDHNPLSSTIYKEISEKNYLPEINNETFIIFLYIFLGGAIIYIFNYFFNNEEK